LQEKQTLSYIHTCNIQPVTSVRFNRERTQGNTPNLNMQYH